MTPFTIMQWLMDLANEHNLGDFRGVHLKVANVPPAALYFTFTCTEGFIRGHMYRDQDPEVEVVTRAIK